MRSPAFVSPSATSHVAAHSSVVGSCPMLSHAGLRGIPERRLFFASPWAMAATDPASTGGAAETDKLALGSGSASGPVGDRDSPLFPPAVGIVERSTNGRGRGRGAGALGRRRLSPSSEEVFLHRVGDLSESDWKGVVKELEAAEGERDQALAAAASALADDVEGSRSARYAAANALRVTTYMYCTCLRHLAQCRRWQEAIDIFERMPAAQVKPSTFCLNATLEACSKAGKWMKCMRLLSEARDGALGVDVDAVSYNICITACSKSKMWEPAEALLAEMQAQGLKPTARTYSSVLSACCSAGRHENALELLRSMGGEGDRPPGGVEPNTFHYNICISALAKVSNGWEQALALLDEMWARGITPNEFVYSSAIVACGNAGESDRAVSLLRSMVGKGLPANNVCFNAAIQACARGFKWEEALSLLEEMPSRGLTPDLFSFSAAIGACAKSGEVDRALALLPEMTLSGVRPDALAYNSVLAAMAKTGDCDRAFDLLSQMRSDGVQPDSIAYATVMKAAAVAGSWEKATVILRDMKARGLKPSEYCFVTAGDACLKAGKPEQAESLLKEMRAHLAPR